MEMIAHQTPSMDLPTGLLASRAQGGQKSRPILVIVENALGLVPAIHDVMHGARILDAQFSWHGQRGSNRRPECQ
jgi:hypothetical protein